MEASSSVFQVSTETFQTDVVERSQQVPVLLLFWAEQVLESRDTRQMLEGLVARYQGKAVLGLVDVSGDQTLAQHLQVRGLPSVRVVHKGQIAQQIDGPQPESTFKDLLDQLTLSSADLLKAELEDVLARRDFDSAITVLQQTVQDEPQNNQARVELADVLVRNGQVDDARQVLDTIPEDAEGRERAQNRLELHEEGAGLGEIDELQAAIEVNSDDLESRYRLAVLCAIAEDYQPALDHAMAILQADRGFRDDIGRMTMIRIFSLLDKGSELSSQYRRRMFNFMH